MNEKLKEYDFTSLQIKLGNQVSSITQEMSNILMAKINELTAQSEKDIQALQEKVFASDFEKWVDS